jgi:hypothetical protein
MAGPNHLCPMCGADGPRRCELEEESGGICPWVESGQYERDCLISDDKEHEE